MSYEYTVNTKLYLQCNTIDFTQVAGYKADVGFTM